MATHLRNCTRQAPKQPTLQRCYLQLAKQLIHIGDPVEKGNFRRVTSTLDPDTFEKCRATPPISIAILLQKHALLLAESSIYTNNLYHDMPPICIAILLQKY